MRHGVKKYKFNRNMGERKALTRSLLVALFTHEKVVTTKAKAKLLKQASDRIISRAKKGDLASKRVLMSNLPHPVIVEKLVSEYGPLFKDRTGGYSRIISLGRRLSDATPMARIELVQSLKSDGEGKSDSAKAAKVSKKSTVSAKVASEAKGRGTRVTPKKEGKGSERAGKTLKEKAVSRRQVSTKKEGKKLAK